MTFSNPSDHDRPDEAATGSFEDQPPTGRYAAERAACRFLVTGGYVSLDEACQTLDLTLCELWHRILQDAGLPESDPPTFSPFA
jgi:hypothetical protein